MKSKETLNFSIPYLISDNLLFTANHTSVKAEIIEISSGKIKTSIDLPPDIACPDLRESYQIVNDNITYVSKSGII